MIASASNILGATCSLKDVIARKIPTHFPMASWREPLEALQKERKKRGCEEIACYLHNHPS